MDDRLERQAALAAITRHSDDILRCCEEAVDILDALEDLKVFSLEEKDYVNENDDYSLVIPKLKENVIIDLNFFNKFCRHITQIEELSSLSKLLVGELTSLVVKLNYFG
jgi:hypothetical protein